MKEDEGEHPVGKGEEKPSADVDLSTSEGMSAEGMNEKDDQNLNESSSHEEIVQEEQADVQCEDSKCEKCFDEIEEHVKEQDEEGKGEDALAEEASNPEASMKVEDFKYTQQPDADQPMKEEGEHPNGTVGEHPLRRVPPGRGSSQGRSGQGPASAGCKIWPNAKSEEQGEDVFFWWGEECSGMLFEFAISCRDHAS